MIETAASLPFTALSFQPGPDFGGTQASHAPAGLRSGFSRREEGILRRIFFFALSNAKMKVDPVIGGRDRPHWKSFSAKHLLLLSNKDTGSANSSVSNENAILTQGQPVITNISVHARNYAKRISAETSCLRSGGNHVHG